MMEASFSLLFLGGLLLVSQLSPGPDVFFVFRTALAQGFRAGVAVGSGIALGFLIQAALVAWVGGWVTAQPWSVYVLYAAAAWLLYLAWRIFPRRWEKVEQGVLQTAVREPLKILFGQGVLCNILNPKCTLFICGLALGPLEQFGSSFSWYAPALVVVLTVSGWFGWMLWSALLQWQPVRHFYLRFAAVIDAVFAILLAFFALGMLVPA